MKSERISPFWVNGYQPFSAIAFIFMAITVLFGNFDFLGCIASPYINPYPINDGHNPYRSLAKLSIHSYKRDTAQIQWYERLQRYRTAHPINIGRYAAQMKYWDEKQRNGSRGHVWNKCGE